MSLQELLNNGRETVKNVQLEQKIQSGICSTRKVTKYNQEQNIMQMNNP